MHNLAAELATVAMVAAMLATPPSKTLVEVVHADPNPSIVVRAEDPLDTMMMWRAVAAFRQAGLDVPPVVITVHENDREPCDGNRGRFTTRDEYAIEICAQHANRRVEMRWRYRTALHELAHAYTAITFVEDDINAFLQINDVKTWLDRKAEWEERGSEIAAESLLWGMGVEPDVRIEASCDELLDNFHYITRSQPVAEAFQNCR